MLAYVDRAPSELPLRPRIVLAAVRLWAGGVRTRGCAIGTLREFLSRFGAVRALWPAHNFFYWFFYWVGAHATRPLSLGCPCCGRVSDDEALLLAALFAPDPSAARASLEGLVDAASLTGATRLARAFAVELETIEGAQAPH